MELSDAEWNKVAFFFPSENLSPIKRGRPKRKTRQVLAGVIWFLTHQATWRDLPQYYPPYQTCHRWFSKWCQQKVMLKLLSSLDIIISKERLAEIEYISQSEAPKVYTYQTRMITEKRIIMEKNLAEQRLSLINCFNTGNLDKYLEI